MRAEQDVGDSVTVRCCITSLNSCIVYSFMIMLLLLLFVIFFLLLLLLLLLFL